MCHFVGYEMDETDIAIVGTHRNGQPFTVVTGRMYKAAVIANVRQLNWKVEGVVKRKAN